MSFRKTLSIFLILAFSVNYASAGVLFVKTQGITLTGADGVTLTGVDGVTLTGVDGFLGYKSNGITLTGVDGVTLTGVDTTGSTGAGGVTYTGANEVTMTGADAAAMTSAKAMTLTGRNGVTFTDANGVQYQAAAVKAANLNGINLSEGRGISVAGGSGFYQNSPDGVTFTGADGLTLTGADGLTLTGADGLVGVRADGTTFTLTYPNGITFTGVDGITFTGVDGLTLTGVDGLTLTGVDTNGGAGTVAIGIQAIDPELLLLLNQASDDSSINAVIVFHQYPNADDLDGLRRIGINGGTLFRALPMVVVSATRAQIAAVSRLAQVRSIYGNRTLALNADTHFNKTQVERVKADRELQTRNGGLPISGRGVTVAVLDTGINSTHNDLSGKVVQNVRLMDTQSAAVGFQNPQPLENVVNTDLTNGHGTFVASVIAASGVSSSGKYNGIAPGAKILGLAAGDLNLMHVLAGFDYVLERGAQYNVRVINCSFSANTVFDLNDPVNVATKMLTDRSVNVVFSSGNSGAGNGTLNPYSAAPWVVGVGATDEKGNLAAFSSRGKFGDFYQRPSLVAPGVSVVGVRSVSELGTVGLGGSDTNRLLPAELPFYTTASGTSFSAPQVAGAIALMLEANRNLRPDQIKDILQRSATPLPKYYGHEVGAGMLNTYAAVLEAAYPERRTGAFRANANRQSVRFETSVIGGFNGTILPTETFRSNVVLPAGTIQTNFSLTWGKLDSLNDLGLKVYGENGQLRGQSNNLNLPGFNGKREKVSLNSRVRENLQIEVKNTLGIGNAQAFGGAVEATSAVYAPLEDVSTLSLADQAAVYENLLALTMFADGGVFRPAWPVTRAAFAETLLRTGSVPQFLRSSRMYSDVNDVYTRWAVESAQTNPSGRMLYDAAPDGNFRPEEATTKLAAAIAFVRAAGLESQTASTALPANMIDGLSVPSEWRGYVAVALQKNLIGLEGGRFNQSRALTRLELARATAKLKNLE